MRIAPLIGLRQRLRAVAARNPICALAAIALAVDGAVALSLLFAYADLLDIYDLIVLGGRPAAIRAEMDDAPMSAMRIVGLDVRPYMIDEAVWHARTRCTLALLRDGATAGYALRSAAAAGKWRVATAVLSSRYPAERTSLRFCAVAALPAGRADILSLALRRGLSPAAKSFGEPLLSAAAFWGDVLPITNLVRAGASVNGTDRFGQTALMTCVCGATSPNYGPQELPRTAAARLLIRLGAAVNAKDYSGRTALDLAVRNGDLALASILLHAGGRASQQSGTSDSVGRAASRYVRARHEP
ncbi:MAG: ankyrin repeat domain-containing protein [Armatimonadetes bacterium]|nr:ankyrin repeat domain-containing protein [Armatimonadota bacterium]MDE2207627.1 ankyrin repeat domain-containing protein [Armatimonadota bacterium]